MYVNLTCISGPKPGLPFHPSYIQLPVSPFTLAFHVTVTFGEEELKHG